MKWLFVTYQFPWPLTHGAWLRVYYLARFLRAGGDEVALLSRPANAEDAKAYEQAGVRLIHCADKPSPVRGPGRCWFSPYVFDEDLARAVEQHSNGQDVVVLVNSQCLQYSQEASKAGVVLCDMIDDPVLEVQRRKINVWPPSALIRRVQFLYGQRYYEHHFIPFTDIVTFVTEIDATNFQQRHPSAKVLVVPNGVDCEYFQPAARKSLQGTNPTVVFTGNMSHPPNEDAAMFLIQEIAPLIWREEPSVRIIIAGCNPSERLQEMSGDRVVVTGWLVDLRPILWDATVALFPMRSGTGIKNKLLEAWATGTAVVATPLACQGIPVQQEVNAVVSEDAEGLASSVVRLIRDVAMRERIAACGLETVRNQLAWPIVTKRLRKRMVEIANGHT